MNVDNSLVIAIALASVVVTTQIYLMRHGGTEATPAVSVPAPAAPPTSGERRETVTPANVNDSRVDNLERQLAGVQQELASVHKTLALIHSRLNPAGGQPSDVVLDEPSYVAYEPSPEERIAAERAQAAEMFSELQTRLDSDPLDAQTGEWASDQIRAGIESRMGDGTRLTGTECRTSMCRIEMQFDDEITRDEMLGQVPDTVPWDSQGFFYADPADPLNLVVFVGREGQTLESPM